MGDTPGTAQRAQELLPILEHPRAPFAEPIGTITFFNLGRPHA
jgi:hypothetical protein